MKIADVDLARIRVNPNNPRRTVDPVKLQELAESIRQLGVQTPILLRPVPVQDAQDLEIVFGERRYRASIIAGMTKIPAQIVAMTDKQAWDEAMVENLQRVDIDPLEEADAIRRAHQEFDEPVAESKKIFWEYGGLTRNCGYVEMDARCYQDPQKRSYKELLKDAKILPTLARAPSGDIYEVLPEKDALDAIKAAGIDLAKERRKAEQDARKQEQEQDSPKVQARELRKQVAGRALETMLLKIEKSTVERRDLITFLLAAIEASWESRETLKRREINNLAAWCKTATPGQLDGLLFELQCGDLITEIYEEYSQELKEGCVLFGIDLQSIEDELRPPEQQKPTKKSRKKKG